ncbi:hypothetical protein ACFWBH_32555 [Streptomyces sp. NPDC059999]|uniref:hypothetical protein n=1 Tax=unclassified Streptomyces TaxID=2593676 RepID=UPI002E3435A5|nr:hypothetical protein [Streptomyces sp. NBC_01426]
MLITLGLIVLIAAVVVAIAGVLGNAGVGLEIGQGFDVFGYRDPATGVTPTRAQADPDPANAPTTQAPPTDESRPAGGVPRRRHLFGH